MTTAGAIIRALRTCLGGLGDLLLPGTCCACEAADVVADGLCAECGRKLLQLVATAYCPRCGTTLGPGVQPRDDGCANCPNPLPRFGRVIRLGAYAPPLQGVVRQLKYHKQEAMRRRLGELLGQAVAARNADGSLDLVLAVPMHWRRRVGRGYDHARFLAWAVARELKLPMGDELVRVRATPPQAHLPKSRRIENVRGAFEARHASTLAGAHVLLVDDVVTTGATANEATRTLLAAGAHKVTLAVVAKADPPKAFAAPREGIR